MRKTHRLNSIVLAVSLAFIAATEARDDKHVLSINAVLQSGDAKNQPDGSVKFFFADQKTPAILKRLVDDSTHQKVSTRRERDESSCKAAFLEALVALQKRANKLGANAVVNIVSFYNLTRSASEFECHAGAAAHVMLKGDFVQIAQ